MPKLLVRGGGRLFGEIGVSGAKNSALPLICASLLTEDSVILNNVPNLSDVNNLLDVFMNIGGRVERYSSSVILKSPKSPDTRILDDVLSSMRASILLAGPMVTRYGEVEIVLPGGCQIGARPFDQHIKGFSRLGVECELTESSLQCKATRILGGDFTFDIVSVTGTENLLMAAVLGKGTTVINNAAREPEIVDLANFLISMGGRITGAGTDKIIVEGVDKLYGTSYTVCSDRIELGTFISAIAVSGGDVLIKNAEIAFLGKAVDYFRAAGCQISEEGLSSDIRVRSSGRLKPIDLFTEPYPGFPTDLQAQFMVMNVCAPGNSTVVENIFENRFMHVYELKKMRADIQVRGNVAVVNGGRKLVAAEVYASDLRASAALVLAGMAAEGETIVRNLHYLDRGYENFEGKLMMVGAEIERC